MCGGEIIVQGVSTGRHTERLMTGRKRKRLGSEFRVQGREQLKKNV